MEFRGYGETVIAVLCFGDRRGLILSGWLRWKLERSVAFRVVSTYVFVGIFSVANARVIVRLGAGN